MDGSQTNVPRASTVFAGALQVIEKGTNGCRSHGRAPGRWTAWGVPVGRRARSDTSGSRCGQRIDDAYPAAEDLGRDPWLPRGGQFVGKVWRTCIALSIL